MPLAMIIGPGSNGRGQDTSGVPNLLEFKRSRIGILGGADQAGRIRIEGRGLGGRRVVGAELQSVEFGRRG